MKVSFKRARSRVRRVRLKGVSLNYEDRRAPNFGLAAF